jgi:FG-GAP-like repeat/Abnormal spindle-like microcephaly-assoc'd, ASPM-SPD-2-Hydin/FG-GAP repeat
MRFRPTPFPFAVLLTASTPATARVAAVILPVLIGICQLAAQELSVGSTTTVTPNPVPFITEPLVPNAVRPGASGFTLVVNGTGFVSSSKVQWNGSALPTTFVSRSQLKAAVPASDIVNASSARIMVFNPTPGGGSSNLVLFEVTRPTSSVALGRVGLLAGANPMSAAVGDFNGDGKLDLAIGNIGSKNVSILLGKGDGTFRAPINFGASTPHALAAGDFNGDGKLDLAIANFAGGSVSIRLGNGNGTFGAPVSYATGNSPTALAAGDLNRDGKLDLVVVNGGNSNGVSSVSILLGNGHGTFHAVAKYPASFGDSVAVGDFNHDGKLDVAVVNFGNSSVSVFLGNGDGTFQTARNFITDNAPTAIAVGDFNGDGKLDLAVANIVSNSGLGDVSVLLGNGNGTFQPPVNYHAGSNPSAAVAGDFNGDRKLDLGVANYGGYGNVASFSVLLGNGNGTFQPAVEYVSVGVHPSSLAMGDFNDDGRLDMVIADPSGSTLTALPQPRLVSGLNAVLEPPAVSFDVVQLVDTTSPSLPVQFSNYGTTTLSIGGIATSSNFIQTHTCGTSLAPGASCTVNVAFKPSQRGTLSGSLSVTDNAPTTQQPISL